MSNILAAVHPNSSQTLRLSDNCPKVENAVIYNNTIRVCHELGWPIGQAWNFGISTEFELALGRPGLPIWAQGDLTAPVRMDTIIFVHTIWWAKIPSSVTIPQISQVAWHGYGTTTLRMTSYILTFLECNLQSNCTYCSLIKLLHCITSLSHDIFT